MKNLRKKLLPVTATAYLHGVRVLDSDSAASDVSGSGVAGPRLVAFSDRPELLGYQLGEVTIRETDSLNAQLGNGFPYLDLEAGVYFMRYERGAFAINEDDWFALASWGGIWIAAHAPPGPSRFAAVSAPIGGDALDNGYTALSPLVNAHAWKLTRLDAPQASQSAVESSHALSFLVRFELLEAARVSFFHGEWPIADNIAGDPNPTFTIFREP